MSVALSGLVVRIGRFELGPVEVSLRPGRVTALVGANGAGKTTLLRAACGVQPLHAGSVSIEGRVLAGMSSGERAARLAFVSQRPAAPPALTVRELVELGRLRLARDRAAVDRALLEVGLDGRASDAVASLSAGQLHRAAVARMLAQVQASTRLVALDEPTGSLDPAWGSVMGTIMRRIAAHGAAVVVATHDFAFLGTCCDDAIALAGGRLDRSGPVAEVATHDVMARLFGTPFVPVSGLRDRPVALPAWHQVS
jgi:iron complex transport system ATP-binding protein